MCRSRALDMPLADVKRLLDFVAHPKTNCRDIDLLINTRLFNEGRD